MMNNVRGNTQGGLSLFGLGGRVQTFNVAGSSTKLRERERRKGEGRRRTSSKETLKDRAKRRARKDIVARMVRHGGRGDGRGWWRVEAGGLREREGEGEGEGRGGEAKTPRERENNALKQQQAATTTLIGHFVHLFDLFKLWDN